MSLEWSHIDLAALADQWLTELRDDSVGDAAKDAVVLMNFTATPETQWEFVLAAVSAATTDDELGHIAAGPVEHLLGHHGEAYINHVERTAAEDPKFLRMLTGAWRYQMSDDVWSRVQVLQAKVANPI